VFGESLTERRCWSFRKRLETEGATFDTIRFDKVGGKCVGHGAKNMFLSCSVLNT
jgi:hypothetical protein